MKDKQVLVLGGAGFLGKRIIYFLKKENISFFYGDINPIVGLEQYFVPLNVLERSDFSRIDKDFSFVINLTGQVTNPSNVCYKLNTQGIKNIIDFAKVKESKIIHVSTLAVFGSSVEEVTEFSDFNPETTYGSLKAVSEFILSENIVPENLSIIRLSNLYGDNQPKGIMSYLLKSVKNNDKVFFNNDGYLKRYYLNVDDAAEMIVKIATNFTCGSFNYPGKDQYSIKELISLLNTLSDNVLEASYEKTKSWENLDRVSSNKISKAFNFTPKKSLKNWLENQFK